MQVATLIFLAALIGLSARLGRRISGRLDLLGLTAGIAAVVGIVTTGMFWGALIAPDANGIVLGMIGGVGIAVALPWMMRPAPVERPPSTVPSLYERVAAPLCLVVMAAAVFNAAYLPFRRDDALAIYLPLAVTIAETGGLPPFPTDGEPVLYAGYPQLIPMLTAARAIVNDGQIDEYGSQALNALLSVLTIGAAFALARTIDGAPAGALAALLLASMPAVARWASTGYADLPAALYLTLALVFAARAWGDGRMLDAALSGTMLGFAVWTKNTALIGVPVIAVFLLIAALRGRITLGSLIAAGVTAFVVGAPFYLRNWIAAGILIPDTAWTDQAQRTPQTLLVLLRIGDYGIGGAAVTAALIAAGVAAVVRRASAQTILALTVISVFVGFWWAFASYDPRFLLLILPAGAAVAGVMLTPAVTRYAAARWLLLAAISASIAYSAVVAVEYKGAILATPSMTHAEKLALVGRD